MNLAYGLYMAEAEGYFKSHDEKVDDLIADIRKRASRGETSIHIDNKYLRKFKLDDLTEHDYQRLAQLAREYD